jgi:hypothetical protein
LTISKEFNKEFPKNCQRIPPKFPKNLRIPKNSQDFEIIQFPTSHLEAENPFGLVFSKSCIPLRRPKVTIFLWPVPLEIKLAGQVLQNLLEFRVTCQFIFE